MSQGVRFYGNGVSFRIWPVILLGSYLVSLRVLSSGACISQPRWIPVQRILGGWQGMLWASLPSAPPEYFRLVLTISTVFHIGTSYCQTTLPSCHHRAWPRWAGLVDGSLRRLWCRLTQKSLFFL